MYPNLNAEMARNKIEQKDIAKALNICLWDFFLKILNNEKLQFESEIKKYEY